MITGVLLSLALQTVTPTLSAQLAAIVARAERLGVRVGVQVEVGGPKGAVWGHRQREGFVPASNMKLFTGALALSELGKDWQFETRFLLHKRDGAPVLRVVTGGDPCLSASLGRGDLMADLAAALLKRDVRALGGCYLDAPAWTGPTRPATWPADQLQRSYAAATGPFVLEEGCVDVTLSTAGRKDGPCTVRVLPEGSGYTIRGKVVITRSRRQGMRPVVAIDRERVRLSGKYWSGAADARYRLAVHDPRQVFGQSLCHRLTAAGVVGARLVTAKPAGDGEAVLIWRSPLQYSMERLLVESSNFHAEQLLRVVAMKSGQPATLEAGRRALEAAFAGLDAGPWKVADGSGLSRGNTVTPLLVVYMLRRALGAPWRRSYFGAFAQSGVSGTLRTRMRNLPGACRAKTGWIRGASALSGTVRTASGNLALFSILMSYAQKRSGLNAQLKRLQDQLVTALHEGC